MRPGGSRAHDEHHHDRDRLGSKLAGVVEAVGANVTQLRPDKLARMPANLSFEQAAAVPVSAVTALQALFDRGRVQSGQRVLVIGASGGVGTFAVQIASPPVTSR